MDEMKISSNFTRMLLSKLAKGVLHKNLDTTWISS